MGNVSCKEHPTETTDHDSRTELPDKKQEADKSAEYRAVVQCHAKLVTALSNGPLSISLKLFASGIISEETYERMLLPSAIPQDKATLLVNNVRKMIEINPTSFSKFVSILSEEQWTKDIVELLQSTLRDIDLAHNNTMPTSSCVDNEPVLPLRYVHYLKTLYTSLTPAQLSGDQWPPSATHKVFNLAMIKTTKVQRGQIEDKYVRQTITGKTDDILFEKKPIELKDILQKSDGNRKVVLIEGAPGCGKSTLSVFICQQWGKGELFTEYQLVILIRLRDPAVQRAKCIADLIPSPDATTAQNIQTKMLANNCQDVLFILDGWDELPSNLRENSLFHQFIKPDLLRRNPIHESAVIVTSRPIASGDLHHFISSRVEILGFTPKELDDYFMECLKGDISGFQVLKEGIDRNPAVAGSCYLPLNASILLHLFMSLSKTLPTTQFEIFSHFILNCIYRHQKKFTELQRIPALESLDELPESIQEPFRCLCELAFKGVMEDRAVLSSTDIPNDLNLLGLVQGVESFAIGKVVSYHFLHLSIQELLAALHIAKNMSESDQVLMFDQLWSNPRFNAVSQFYAAITKLKASGIKDVIIKHCHDEGLLLSNILNCLCEAQNSSLCVSVASEMQRELKFSQDITLSPSDCYSIGFFLSCVCTSKMADGGEFTVDLDYCDIGDHGCKYLVSGLQKCLDSDNAVMTTLLNMNIGQNGICNHEVCYLSSFLEIGCFKSIDMRSSIILAMSTDEDDGLYRMLNFRHMNKLSLHGSFADHLKQDTTLTELILQGSGITPSSAKHLSEGLAGNKHLEGLDISCNEICDDGIEHIAQALRVNQGLRYLGLCQCGITDVGLEQLATSLEQNKTLEVISLSSGAMSELVLGIPNHFTAKVAPVLSNSLKRNLTLTMMDLDHDLDPSVCGIIEESVNAEREKRRLPHIKLKNSHRPSSCNIL